MAAADTVVATAMDMDTLDMDTVSFSRIISPDVFGVACAISQQMMSSIQAPPILMDTNTLYPLLLLRRLAARCMEARCMERDHVKEGTIRDTRDEIRLEVVGKNASRALLGLSPTVLTSCMAFGTRTQIRRRSLFVSLIVELKAMAMKFAYL